MVIVLCPHDIGISFAHCRHNIFSSASPFDIAIFCVPDSSRAAAATSGGAAAQQQQQQHPDWQMHQASVFASLLQHISTAPAEPSAQGLTGDGGGGVFAADALADGVVVGTCRIMVRERLPKVSASESASSLPPPPPSCHHIISFRCVCALPTPFESWLTPASVPSKRVRAPSAAVFSRASRPSPIKFASCECVSDARAGASVHILCTGSLYLVGDALSLLPQSQAAAMQI